MQKASTSDELAFTEERDLNAKGVQKALPACRSVPLWLRGLGPWVLAYLEH